MTTREMLRRFCVVMTLFYCVNSQAFSSVRNLEIIYNEEGKLVEALRDFVTVSLTEGHPISDSITSFLKTVDEARSRVYDVEKWMGNPINALHFVIRVMTDWEQVIASVTCDTCRDTGAAKGLIRVWTAAKNIKNYWPTLIDKQEIYKSILRLWNLYDLQHTDILNGKIGNSQTDPLTSGEVMEMLQQSKLANLHYNRVVWLQSLADRRSNTSLSIDMSVSDQELDFDLAMAYADFMFPSRVIDIMSKYEDSEERIVHLRYMSLMRRAYAIPVMLQKREVTRPTRDWSN
ncbi:uncharacterized protein LOC110455684, partial [Mizuhopecten yessoensis]|uniref:uncharacterized protein LOC110455684 n=1 Tax=Mizuhopecten yessoensis TaxID=6573 RepID=UPI000B45DA61